MLKFNWWNFTDFKASNLTRWNRFTLTWVPRSKN